MCLRSYRTQNLNWNKNGLNRIHTKLVGLICVLINFERNVQNSCYSRCLSVHLTVYEQHLETRINQKIERDKSAPSDKLKTDGW